MTIRGVVFTVVATILSILLLIFSYDYYQVRVAAAKGAAAFEFLDKTIKAQQAAKPPAPPPQEEKK